MKRFAFAAALAASLLAVVAALAAATPDPPHAIDFAGPDGVVEITDGLVPYHAPSAKPEPDGSGWYLITATNSSIRPAARVLQASQPQSVSFRILPYPTRPRILAVASSDPLVVIDKNNAYGRRAWRVVVPPATTVAIAVELANAAQPPSIFAWTEPALAAHNRQLAIFTTAVWAVIAAATLLAAGLAVTLGHAPARWAAVTLLLILLERLSETGLFDGSLATAVGGPYGLMAMFAGLSLVAGAMLADAIVPLREVWPLLLRPFRFVLFGIIGLAVLAYMGVPAATVLTDTIVVLGAAATAIYLVYRGRLGAQAARVAAPSALVFALVAFASALATMNNSGDSWATSAAGGFAAAGALLLALAVAAGEGIAVLPFQSLATAPDTFQDDVAAYESAPRESAAAHAHTNAALQAIGASHQGVFDLDFEVEAVKLSRDAAALIGLTEAASRLPHHDWIDRIHPEDQEVYTSAIDDYRSHPGLAFRVEFRVRSESGRYPWFELRATMLGDHAPASRCLGLMADVTTRKESESELLQRTLRDPLTGLGNRVALMEELEQLGSRFAATTFVLLDIDRFKSIHASLGDSGGDALLTNISERLTKRFKSPAEVFRVGGDAFAVLIPAATAAPDSLGNDLVEACAAPYSMQGRNVFAPASVGVALGSGARDPLDLIKNAELALLQAKRLGGACARVYSQDLEQLAPGDAVALETDLRRAIEDKQLDVYYQPIVRLADNTVAGFEALLRWNHPTKGLVSPSEFIAHSEETGSIVALGRFALERAGHDVAQWQRFFPLSPPLFVSVNVSRRQLRDGDFIAYLGRLLRSEAIAPGTLKLEVTESTVAANQDVQAAMERAKALGAGLSIDDFGTGVSSLSQLKTLPFDTIKIDQSFLARHANADTAADGDTVLRSIISLAHDLRRSVVVEGVESAEDAAWLKQLGVEFAQGFYFSQALPSAGALEYIARHFDTRAQ
ncbi:MAG TPA: GGDEF and EAL domain-containing protein [Rhizomicrobium sp.]|jgi:diguanylate cyclase (GGDEF)-like protein/PAS domain S-box-containing protein|nr:GGDEF and EAL domain-containing protein [Rhizomicrobium sp.]